MILSSNSLKKPPISEKLLGLLAADLHRENDRCSPSSNPNEMSTCAIAASTSTTAPCRHCTIAQIVGARLPALGRSRFGAPVEVTHVLQSDLVATRRPRSSSVPHRRPKAVVGRRIRHHQVSSAANANAKTRRPRRDAPYATRRPRARQARPTDSPPRLQHDPATGYLEPQRKGAPGGEQTTQKMLLRSLPRRRARILWLAPPSRPQRLVLNQIPMNIQEPDGFVLERRAAAVVAEVDRRTLVDRVDHSRARRSCQPRYRSTTLIPYSIP
jgi:hypothetical protein